MSYAITIATRGAARWALLESWLPALGLQEEPPACVVLINNNGDSAMPTMRLPELPFEVVVLPNDFLTLGDAHGSQTALQQIGKDYDTLVKWDDDLIPDGRGCLSRLVRLVRAGFAAAGGLYPQAAMAGAGRLGEKGLIPYGAANRQLQFHGWSGSPVVIRRRHLYSSFAYDPKLAAEVGGFCTEYSRLGYRHETDFTLRLDHARPGLAVDTGATATHLVHPGGVRELSPEDHKQLALQDIALFTRRMSELGIDPTL